VEHGASINETNNEGKTPLGLARKGGHKDVVEYLKQSGADEICRL